MGIQKKTEGMDIHTELALSTAAWNRLISTRFMPYSILKTGSAMRKSKIRPFATHHTASHG